MKLEKELDKLAKGIADYNKAYEELGRKALHASQDDGDRSFYEKSLRGPIMERSKIARSCRECWMKLLETRL